MTITPDYVKARIEHAGVTLLAIPSKDCLPAGMGRNWPDAVHELVRLCAYRPGQLRPPLPSSLDIIAMDTAWEWVAMLRGNRRAALAQRVVMLRSLRDPLTDKYRFPWPTIARLTGLSVATLERTHRAALERIAALLAGELVDDDQEAA